MRLHLDTHTLPVLSCRTIVGKILHQLIGINTIGGGIGPKWHRPHDIYWRYRTDIHHIDVGSQLIRILITR